MSAPAQTLTAALKQQRTIKLVLPYPPPVNNLFATYGNRRIPSARYKAWRTEAAACIVEQRQRPIAGPFNVEMTFERPSRANRDLDGLAKAPLDALVTAGLIEDDHLSRRITLEWLGDDPVAGARAFITVCGVVT